MGRRYLTVAEYSQKHGVPQSTVRKWVKDRKLQAVRSVRPMLIPDDQAVPDKDPDIHKWRYTWKNR